MKTKLKWIAKGVDIRDISEKLGIHKNQLYNILSGQTGCSIKRAKQIVEASGGKLTIFDLRPDLAEIFEGLKEKKK